MTTQTVITGHDLDRFACKSVRFLSKESVWPILIREARLHIVNMTPEPYEALPECSEISNILLIFFAPRSPPLPPPPPPPPRGGGALLIVSSTCGYVPGKCPCFEPFYCQFAHAKSQFYFHNAYKIHRLALRQWRFMTIILKLKFSAK